MPEIAGRRMTAEIDGDFVVFLIGARFNSFHLLQTFRDLGGRLGMKHMLDYLMAPSGKGPARVPDGPADHRAVLAVVRPSGEVRQRQQRPASGRVAQVLTPGRHQQPDRNLA